MFKNYLIKKTAVIFIVLITVVLIFSYQAEFKNGVISGILLCGNVIIPSLFPFTVCVLILMRSGFPDLFISIRKPIKWIFGINISEFTAMFLSFIGGYPIGAKLIDKAYNNGNTTKERARNILLYSINAGPAFIVLAIGEGFLSNKALGFVLLFSHILSSLIIAFFLSFNLRSSYVFTYHQEREYSLADNFVESTTESANTILNICAIIILFSGVSSAFASFEIPFFTFITNLLEVTTAISNTKNIYLISFLLGFGGISIWLQVIFCCKKIQVNLLHLLFSRILHGLLSVALTFIELKVLKIDLQTLSNGFDADILYIYKTPTLAASLLIMTIILIISLERKFDSRNLKNDLV